MERTPRPPRRPAGKPAPPPSKAKPGLPPPLTELSLPEELRGMYYLG